ncbi:hypothetical protein [Parasphingorhabdus sp.]|uniref:hypothetical protein n=1 Tax=Parasphingorhabdus sp. TaxID=2709688 RepID=UPI003002CFE4
MVSRTKSVAAKVLGRLAPVLLLALAIWLSSNQPVGAQTAEPPVSSQPVPNGLELSKLIWSTMAAVDHANQSGNYSVLRDNAAPGFQIINNPARLSEIFAGLRASRIDLSNTLLLAPTYSAPPAMVEQDVIRVRGAFGLRPTAISFDLYYKWVEGRWRLYGVSIGQESIANIQPEAAPRR